MPGAEIRPWTVVEAADVIKKRRIDRALLQRRRRFRAAEIDQSRRPAIDAVFGQCRLVGFLG